ALDSTAGGEGGEVADYVEEVLQTLDDLIEYFKQPEEELEHEEKQGLLRSLIKRQDLFKEEGNQVEKQDDKVQGREAAELVKVRGKVEGMLSLLSKCIDRLNLYDSAAHFAETAGEEAGEAWKDILNLLYELLGADGSSVCAAAAITP
ncbi:hypothetical protein CRUP_005081, partial [Coryphaenoides rupestris]